MQLSSFKAPTPVPLQPPLRAAHLRVSIQRTKKSPPHRSIIMSVPLVTYEDTKTTLGTLPSLAPRPNSTNIRALTIDLSDKLTTIQSHQSADHGYSGVIDDLDDYALKCNVPWRSWPDPGPHRPEGTTRDERDNTGILYDANKVVYDSQINVIRVINAALNIAVPREYCGSTTGDVIGVNIIYHPSDCPRKILANLRCQYGRATPAKKQVNEKNSAPDGILLIPLKLCSPVWRNVSFSPRWQNLNIPQSR